MGKYKELIILGIIIAPGVIFFSLREKVPEKIRAHKYPQCMALLEKPGDHRKLLEDNQFSKYNPAWTANKYQVMGLEKEKRHLIWLDRKEKLVGILATHNCSGDSVPEVFFFTEENKCGVTCSNTTYMQDRRAYLLLGGKDAEQLTARDLTLLKKHEHPGPPCC